jgi:hypothetical protein
LFIKFIIFLVFKCFIFPFFKLKQFKFQLYPVCQPFIYDALDRCVEFDSMCKSWVRSCFSSFILTSIFHPLLTLILLRFPPISIKQTLIIYSLLLRLIIPILIRPNLHLNLLTHIIMLIFIILPFHPLSLK